MGPARVRWYACDTRPGSAAPFFVGRTARLRLCGDGGCGARFGFAAGLPGPGQEFGDAVGGMVGKPGEDVGEPGAPSRRKARALTVQPQNRQIRGSKPRFNASRGGQSRRPDADRLRRLGIGQPSIKRLGESGLSEGSLTLHRPRCAIVQAFAIPPRQGHRAASTSPSADSDGSRHL
jgi:hypothetical protein